MTNAMGTFSVVSVLCFLCVCHVTADTPANCTYEQILGTWKFNIGPGGNDNTVNCSVPFKYASSYEVSLYFPDVAFDTDGNRGFWTLIYNQGFEVIINNRKFFAFSMFEKSGTVVTSMCSKTFPGWVHDDEERNWACYEGMKTTDGVPNTRHTSISRTLPLNHFKNMYRTNKLFIDEINSRQRSWTATVYREYDDWTLVEHMRRAGGKRSADAFPNPAPVYEEERKVADKLPKEFDWRSFNGMDFVSPVRNQMSCGSCYAFASMALHEARLRVATNNSVQKVFSTQDVVSCSEYAQGCEGGFPYLIAGKYGQDFGLIEDTCFPYTAKDDPCKKSTCPRYYTRDYYYIGGYYGACNEVRMRTDLINHGPIAISFQVYSDFMHYKSGIYHHTGLVDKFNPWEITNHVVLVVGYGEDSATGEKFWIVKNSWGTKWGEDGFFRIRRGSDECSMESIAVGTFPEL